MAVLAYFDKEAHTRVIADASPVGLGAVLVQENDGALALWKGGTVREKRKRWH